jgi:hypothetical protein
MKTATAEKHVARAATARNGGAGESPLPSAGFVEAVAALLETDATDLLAEMGYRCHETVPKPSDLVASAGKWERK